MKCNSRTRVLMVFPKLRYEVSLKAITQNCTAAQSANLENELKRTSPMPHSENVLLYCDHWCRWLMATNDTYMDVTAGSCCSCLNGAS